jgi:hypothetical protein
MKQHVFIPFLVLNMLVSCVHAQVTKAERPGQPDIYQVAGDDKEMNNAIKKLFSESQISNS